MNTNLNILCVTETWTQKRVHAALYVHLIISVSYKFRKTIKKHCKKYVTAFVNITSHGLLLPNEQNLKFISGNKVYRIKNLGFSYQDFGLNSTILVSYYQDLVKYFGY